MTEAEYYAQQLQGLIQQQQQQVPQGLIAEPQPGTPQAEWEQRYMANPATAGNNGPVVTNGPIEKTPYEIQAMNSATPGATPEQQHLLNRTAAGPGMPMQGRVDALNREHNAHGIMAGTDAKGQLVLSNYAPSPGVVAVPQIEAPGAIGVGSSVRGILDQMRKATDIDTARGLQAQLNEAAAQETAKIQGEARKTAENKIGVPQLEFALNRSIELDRNSPSFYPGRGDSPVTAQARTQLNAARGAADLEAQRYIKSNVSANALDAAIKTAGMETARISRLADKQETTQANADAKRLAKEDFLTTQKEDAAKSLTEDMKVAIRALNPVLANAPDTDLADNVMRMGKANPHYLAAVTAPRDDLPKLAAQGNQFSATLVKAKEAALGINPIDTDNNLRMIQDIMNEKGSSIRLKAAMMAITPPGPEREKTIAAAIADLTGKTIGSAADKALATDAKYNVARQVVAAGMTDRYMQDVTTWRSPDPDLNAAIAQAKAVTGKTNIEEVANAYIGDAVGAEARAKLNTLINIMENQTAMNKDSLFGMPSPTLLRNKLIGDQLKTRLQAGPLGTMFHAKGGGINQNPTGMDKQTLFGDPFNPRQY